MGITYEFSESLWFGSYLDTLESHEKEKLSEICGECEENGLVTQKEIKKYLKHNPEYETLCNLLGTKNIKNIVRIVQHILQVERNNEWALAVSGRHAKSYFGWFD